MSGKMPSQGEFCWNELMTSDTQKAAKFYTELFGWVGQEHKMNDMAYTLFKNGDKDVGGMMQIPADQPGQIPPHWMAYIAVDDLDAMVAKAKALGATIRIASHQVEDFGRFAIIQDPTGAGIALWQSLKSCE